MKNKIKEYIEKMFENIKHFDVNGSEYWEARDLMSLLEYSKWKRFLNAINNAKVSCENSGYIIEDHFPDVGEMVNIGSKIIRKITEELGGAMPEELPTPEKSLKEL